MACQVFRNQDNQIARVTAPNGEESKLYADLSNLSEVKDSDMALDMWLLAYTPGFKKYFGDWENGEPQGLVDDNGEPFVTSIQNYLNSQASAPVTETPSKQEVDSTYLATTLDRLKEQFGIAYELVNEPDQAWKGKFENGKVIINQAAGVTKDTPFHEYLHPFVLVLKKENPALYNKLLEEMQALPEGQQEITNVEQSDAYKNDTAEEKLDEALVSYLGKLAAGNISEDGNPADAAVIRARKSIYTKFRNWLLRIFSKMFGVRLSELELNFNLQDIADMVSVGTAKIDMDGLPVVDRPFYQLDDKTKAFKAKVMEQANPLQKKIVDEVYKEDNPDQVVLDEEKHIYTHVGTGVEYMSTTTAIKGGMNDPENKFEMNRLFGKAFDGVLQGLIEGLSYEEATKSSKGILNHEVSKRAFESLQAYLIGVTSDGSIVLPQVILADHVSRIAGSLDLFVIRPDGTIRIIDLKVSKNSIRAAKYSDKKYDVNDGSLLQGERLTTKQQHGIQVGIYKRLSEISGMPVEQTQTVHIHLQLEGDGPTLKIADFKWEGVQNHYPSENIGHVNRVVSTQPGPSVVNRFRKELGLNNPANDPDFLSDEEAQPETPMTDSLYAQIFGVVKSYIDKLQLRRTYLENLRSSISFQPKKETVDRISELLAAIDTDIVQGKANVSFGRLLNYSKEQLEKIYSYLNNPENVDKKEYVDVVLEAEKFVESYRGLVALPKLGLSDKNQMEMLKDVQNLLTEVKEMINPALESYVKKIIREKSNKKLTEEELEQVLKESFDISLADYNLGDMATSKDTLLAIADKIYKEAVQKAMDRTDSFIEKIKAAGNALVLAMGGAANFDFMLAFNEAGEFTGRYVQRIGKQYWDMYYKLRNDMKGPDGEQMKYKMIDDLDAADPADVLYNIELEKKKRAWREFTQAEVINGDQVEDGENHKYTDEFKQIRSKYEVLYKGFWVRREGVSETQHKQFLEKYHTKIEYTGKIYEKDGTFKGRTERRIGYFPKYEYVEVRDVSSKGVDLRDSKYVKLMNPTNELERAQSEFYKVFDSEMRSTLEKLPVDIQRQMLGKVARVKNNYINTAKKQGAGFFKAVAKSVRDWFDLTPNVYSMQRITDENGYLQDSLPIMFTGKVQNQGRITFLEEQLKKIKNEFIVDKRITREEYYKEKERLEQSLKAEKSRIKLEEINTDMVENIIAFRRMAEKYEQMSDVESALLSISKVVEKKNYYVTDALQRKFLKAGSENKDPVLAEGKDSLANKRLKKWFKMVYYNNDEYDASTVAQVMQKYQNMTSLKGMGLNVFGAVNNYVMGRINNAIEAYGGILFDRSAYFRASKEFNVDFMPGLMKGLGEKDGHYKMTKHHSKYHAMVDMFRVVRKNQFDSGQVDSLSFMYMFQEGGEYNVQSKTGIAVLMSEKFKLTHNVTGETLSIFDAFEFDESTGKLKIKEGFELSDEQRYKITNYIYETNKQIHGNYAWEDRMTIQSHWLGQLAAQFHKWVYPAYKARFQKRYEDENLGELEGRYRTFYNLMKYMYQEQGNFLEKMQSGWAGMTEVQKKNMYKNLAEFGFLMSSILMTFVFKMLAENTDDEDKNLKRLLNFLQFQGTRQRNEIMTMIPVLGTKEAYQLAKSPIAVLTTMRDHGEAVGSLLSLPFPPYDKNYYERGPHKGGLKAWKEVSDVIPALAVLNRWESFDTVRSFYIR
jgi:hypothetical protein